MNVTTSPVNTNNLKWAVFVAQLVEGSLPTPEVRGSNPVIGRLLYGTFVCCQPY